jgi:hypothetical protein
MARVQPARIGPIAPVCLNTKFKVVPTGEEKAIEVVSLDIALILEMSRDYWRKRYHELEKAAAQSPWENLWANGTNGHPTNRPDY